jgi:hypothetical protein
LAEVRRDKIAEPWCLGIPSFCLMARKQTAFSDFRKSTQQFKRNNDNERQIANMRIVEVIIDGFKSYAVRTVISGWDDSFNSSMGHSPLS